MTSSPPAAESDAIQGSATSLPERIAQLEADNIRLRAALMQRDSALAFALEDRQALAASVPGLPRRAELARRVEVLADRLQSVMRERRSLPMQHIA